jgi:hypothetical protein
MGWSARKRKGRGPAGGGLIVDGLIFRPDPTWTGVGALYHNGETWPAQYGNGIALTGRIRVDAGVCTAYSGGTPGSAIATQSIDVGARTIVGWVTGPATASQVLACSASGSRPFMGIAPPSPYLGWLIGGPDWTIARSLSSGLHHYAITYSGAGGVVQSYYDGSPAASISPYTWDAGTTALLRVIFNGSAGSVYDMRVYSRALSAGEIAAIFGGAG